MATTITLLGRPRSTQHIYKARVLGRYASMYMTAEGKALKESYRIQTLNQWRKKTLYIPIEIGIKFYFPTRRKCDIDNFNKLVLDALNGIVYGDDDLIYKMTVEKFHCRENPRVEITILD